MLLFNKKIFLIFCCIFYLQQISAQLYDYNWKPVYFVEIDAVEKLVFSKGNRYIKPVLVDLDNDNVVDLITGNENGTLAFFQNIGSNKNPKFRIKEHNIRTKLTLKEGGSGLRTIDVGNHSAPAFADFDGDADLDLLVGNQAGHLWYFENIGNINSPLFQFVTDRFFGIEIKNGFTTPNLFDVDENGLIDLVIGSAQGDIYYYPNQGNFILPDFQLPRLFYKSKKINHTAPIIIDWNEDGKYDMLSGQKKGQVLFFNNSGTNSNPIFDQPKELFQNLDLGGFTAPAFFNAQLQDEQITIIGHRGSMIYSFAIRDIDDEKALWNIDRNVTKHTQLVNLSQQLTFSAGDVDNNGFKDLLIGDTSKLVLYLNFGKNKNGHYKLKKHDLKILDGFPASNISPELSDLNGDGFLDIIIGTKRGSLFYFQNQAQDKNELSWKLIRSSVQDIDAGKSPIIRFIDYDDDGDNDLFIINETNQIKYYQNVGNAIYPLFELAVPHYTLDETVDAISPLSIAFYDWNQDNTLTLLLGSNDNRIFVIPDNRAKATILNTKGKSDQYHFLPYEIDVWRENKNNDKIKVYPYITDLENDGKPELFIGNNLGEVLLFTSEKIERKSVSNKMKFFKGIEDTTKKPPSKKEKIEFVFEQQDTKKKIKSINYKLNKPVNLLEKKVNFQRPVPAFADLDNDGDQDLVVGSADGKLRIYFNEGSKEQHQFNTIVSVTLDTHQRHISPMLLDLDSDDDFDIIFGNAEGELYALMNQGSAEQFDFSEDAKKIIEKNVSSNAAPAFYLNDNAIQIMVGNLYGQIDLFHQQSLLNDDFIFKKIKTNFLNQSIGIDIHPNYSDINLDGKAELIIGNALGALIIFEQEADAELASKWKRNDQLLPDYQFSKGVYPTIVDLDGDRVNDFVIGSSSQEILFFRNATKIDYTQ